MTEDLKTALITWPRAPYQCGSAEGWMQKAHDRIVELEGALERLSCRHVTEQPLWWQLEARAALQPKAGS